MDQIGADCMPPGHIAPYVALWVMLVKEVILAGIKYAAIRIVQPILTRAEMELWAKSFPVGGLLSHQLAMPLIDARLIRTQRKLPDVLCRIDGIITDQQLLFRKANIFRQLKLGPVCSEVQDDQ